MERTEEGMPRVYEGRVGGEGECLLQVGEVAQGNGLSLQDNGRER